MITVVTKPIQIRFLLPLALVACCLAFASSCDRQNAPVPDNGAKAKPKSVPGSSDEGVISLGAMGLVDDKLHIEPKKDAWQTELFNDMAGQQLASIKDLIKDPEASSNAPISGICSDDIVLSPLRPVKLTTIYDDEAFLIKRQEEPAADKAVLSGPAVFMDQLTALSDGFVDGSMHIEFKIFDIRPGSGAATTRIAAKLSGRTAAGFIQESSTWVCDWTLPKGSVPPQLRSVTVEDYEWSLGRSVNGRPLFADCTESVFDGVSAYDEQLSYDIDHWTARLESAFGIMVSGWEGLALGDANGDGLDDLYVCQPGGLPNRLFVQKPDGSVFDASSLAGVDWRLPTQSALFVDLDNDNDQDLVIATTLGVIFMANDGRGTFTVKSNALIPEAAPLALASADYDLDGDLDVYAACYSKRRGSEKSTIMGRPMPYHDANNGGRNVLFRNDRDWKFSNATVAVGLDANNRRFSLAASWEDYDNDGDPDLYVANDYGRNNLYRNDRSPDGTSTFSDVAKEAGVEDISAGMSVSWGDYNGDGNLDLYVSNMWSSAGNRVTYQRQFLTGASEEVLSDLRRHARGNSLFLNRGDGTFADVSETERVTMGRWAWGSRFVDLNNDGWQDILVANGFITQPDDPGDL
ncbi:MAG: hypothetical protein ACI8TX_001993 [Hyphomicrobiaceae bacterium]|jgi:hypothetical protein